MFPSNTLLSLLGLQRPEGKPCHRYDIRVFGRSCRGHTITVMLQSVLIEVCGNQGARGHRNAEGVLRVKCGAGLIQHIHGVGEKVVRLLSVTILSSIKINCRTQPSR